MLDWQFNFIFAWGIGALIGFLYSLNQSHRKGNAYGTKGLLWIYGSFVMGDMTVFGIFWAAVSTITLYLNDWLLFWLIFFVFWTVRSLGESIYWFLQQFSTIQREPPIKWWHYKIFKSEAVWFINQIFMQCVTVISIIGSIYIAKLWLDKF